MNARQFAMIGLLAAAFTLGCWQARGQENIEQGFINPPDSAKPHTWWHWMNGNITKEGITADLEAMKRVGIGGAQIFNAAEGIPHGPIRFNSPEWRQMVKHAAAEAQRLGLELCIHNCGGWSSSGGPWNTPEHGMQVVVSSEKTVTGPSHFEGVLPQPAMKLDTYHDIAVMAFRTPAHEAVSMRAASPKVSTSDGKANGAKAIDGNANTSVSLPLPEPKSPQWIMLEFARPWSARELTIAPGPGTQGFAGKLEVSDDGQHFRTVTAISIARGRNRQTFTFEPVSGRFFRVLFTSAAKRSKQLAIAEVELSPRLAIGGISSKAFYDRGGEQHPVAQPAAADEDVIAPEKMIDLTAAMHADGKLAWDVPQGNWTILRVGYTPNGAKNHPAPSEGEGLECDKLSKEAAEAHWNGLMGPLLAELGPLAGKSFNNVLIDSYEVGTQNWTPKFAEEFKRRRGYDATKYLPVLTGRVVGSMEISERFLWDFRRTIADLFAENYSGAFADMAHRNGLLYSVEPYGSCPSDDIQYGEYADIPMSEFWPGGPGNTNPGNAKLAASIAHVFGRKFVGAESFTAAPEAGKWLKDPYSLKAQGDTVYCAGVNRIIYHRYAHQPWLNRYPGMTMGQWGTHFERTVTWWEQSTAWLKYQARCQYLLQSGLFVADACFFCGEGAPNSLHGKMPAGYDFDGCNTDALLQRMSVKDGRIVLPDGMSYRMLVLPGDVRMRPATLRKIKELAAAGATIIGPKPSKSPSLEGYPQCDDEVKQLADELWGKAVADKSVEAVLDAMKLPPDFECQSKSARLTYIHRNIGGADVYFVANPKERMEETACTFRVAGKAPELWHADSGVIEPAPVYAQADGRTTVPLRLDPSGSVFVVFRKAVEADHAVAFTHTAAQAPAAPAAPRAELVIVKAEYGAFAKPPADCADVTALVKKAVASGTTRIRASNVDFGGDPAPDVEKELRVQVTIDGKPKTLIVAENQAVEIPAGAQIVKAEYGVLHDEPAPNNQAADVTAKVASLVKDGALSVRVDNSLAGRDPAYLVVKELRLTYRYQGVEKTVRAGEHQEINLPEDTEVDVAPPAWRLAAREDGSLEAELLAPGAVEAKTAAGRTLTARVDAVARAVEVTGSWELTFPPNWGAPPKVTLDKLISWTEHADTGVKYFSGTAAYHKEIDIPAELLQPGKCLYLDLGKLKNIAQVSLNGKDVGILWKPPFCVDITAAARPGKNALQVKITNLWPNRLIGDELLPEDREWKGIQLKEWPQWLLEGKPSPTGRFTFTTWHHWTRADQPLPSGLLGPVTLRPGVKVILQQKQ